MNFCSANVVELKAVTEAASKQVEGRFRVRPRDMNVSHPRQLALVM